MLPTAEVRTAVGMGDEELGLSILRTIIEPDSRAWAYALSNLQEAKSYGQDVAILATPWSPPASMKDNGSTTNGGRLLVDHYDDYAAHLSDCVQYVCTQRVAIDVVSVQNEPDWHPDYDSCDWSGTELRDFVPDHGDRIQGTRLLAGESLRFDRAYTDPCLEDPGAAANFEIVGGHLYGAESSGLFAEYPLAEPLGKRRWMTEWLAHEADGDGAAIWGGSNQAVWDATLDVVLRSVHTAMDASWNAYIWWWARRFYSFIGDGDEAYGTQAGEVLKRGWAFSQYSRFVRPGSTRVGVSTDGSFSLANVTAYEGDDEIVIVILNRATEGYSEKGLLRACAMSGPRGPASSVTSKQTNRCSRPAPGLSCDATDSSRMELRVIRMKAYLAVGALVALGCARAVSAEAASPLPHKPEPSKEALEQAHGPDKRRSLGGGALGPTSVAAELLADDGAQAEQSRSQQEAEGTTPKRAPEAPVPPGESPAAPTAVATGGVARSPESARPADRLVQVMMDIEAELAIEVRDVGAAILQARELVLASGGQVLDESLSDEKGDQPTASLTLRIPSAHAFDFLAKLEMTGAVRSRRVTSRDVGKEYFDAALRLKSLQQVLERYRALLQSSQSVEDTLKVEEQIARVSGEIEQIEGQLRWLRNRVARATVRLELYAKGGWVEPVVTPEAKIYPGVRAVGSWDWRGAKGSHSLVGAGISLRFTRHFSLDFDAQQDLEAPRGDFEATMLTVGGEMYSDFLGAGQRRWFNPYVGFRGGYGHIEGSDQLLLGGTVGLEFFKSDVANVDLDVRVLGGVGDRLGAHCIVVPALGANVAF